MEIIGWAIRDCDNCKRQTKVFILVDKSNPFIKFPLLCESCLLKEYNLKNVGDTYEIWKKE